MEKRTIRVPDEVAEEIDRRAENEDVSESAAARELLRRGMEADELEREVERLNRERRQLLEQREGNQQLRRYVEDEQRYRQADIVKRVKWFLGGMD
jgi:predicted transcriptional regulator